jgi:signal transduction histidine kinase
MIRNYLLKILKKGTYFSVSFLFISIQLLAFQYADVDSLKLLLNNKEIKNDSIRQEIYEELYKNTKLTPENRLEFAEKAYYEAKKLNNSNWLFKTNLGLGHIYKKSGDVEIALSYYLKGLKEAEKQKDNRRIALIYSSLGSLYRLFKDYVEALNYFNKGIEMLRLGNNRIDSTNLGKSLLNAGEVYRLVGKYDSAVIYFEESGKIFQEVEFLMGTAYNMGNIGLIHAQRGEHQIAKNKMDLASAILKDLGDFYPIAVYDLYIADIYKENNDIARALEYAQHSLEISKEYSLKEQIRDANLKLSELYDAQNDYQKAYYHQSQYLVYRDSINSEEKIREIADLRTEYEVGQREAEIALLKTEQENRYILFVSMAIIILLLAILSIIYFRNSKRKQRLNSILREQKEEIETQRDQMEDINETREKFLSIIAHDLMGPVNSFKGLSAIMKMSIEKQDKKDLLDIHQVLNKTINNMSNLLTNLLDWSVTQQGSIPYYPEKLYVHQLTSELFDLFFNTAENKNIKLKAEVTTDLSIWADENSVKTILRNLVSNALKFTEENGSIEVSAEKNDGFIAIKVQDTGTGMLQDKIDLLLTEDHFERSQGTKGEKGVGLGLQLVKEFTQMNKGKLEIESQIHRATTFIVYMPDYHSPTA